LLHGVFDVGGVAGAFGEEAVEPALVADDEVVEGGFVAGQGACDELLVGEQLGGGGWSGLGDRSLLNAARERAG
jgi:hypothetical protein